MNCSDWLQLYWARIPIYVEIRLVCPGSVTSSRAQVEVLMRTRAVCVTRFGELSWLGIQIRRFSAFTEFLKGWESVLGNACAGIQSYFGSSRRCIFMSRICLWAQRCSYMTLHPEFVTRPWQKERGIVPSGDKQESQEEPGGSRKLWSYHWICNPELSATSPFFHLFDWFWFLFEKVSCSSG